MNTIIYAEFDGKELARVEGINIEAAVDYFIEKMYRRLAKTPEGIKARQERDEVRAKRTQYDEGCLLLRAAAIGAGRNPDACHLTVIGGWWRVRRKRDSEEMGAGNAPEAAIASVTLGKEWNRIPKVSIKRLQKITWCKESL